MRTLYSLRRNIAPALALVAGGWLAASFPLHAAEEAGFSVTQTARGVTVKLGGQLFTEYVISEANKPYLWPVIGPTGKPMTRAYPMEKLAGEQHDHPHHRGIWFGHEHLNGADTWHELLTLQDPKLKPEAAKAKGARLGATRHREFRSVNASKQKAVIESINDYFDVDGKKMVEDFRRYTFSVDGAARVIDCEIEFLASAGPAEFGDAKDAGFNIRVPSTMAVDSKKGGRILNSEGLTDAAAWGKRAKWCAYTGPVEGETLGIAMLNHPTSFRFPTPWHVRTYGLLTANPFGTHSLDQSAPDGTHTLKAGERLHLKHRILFFKGEAQPAQIEAAFKKYAAEK